jgi:hypothetical protein
MTQNNLELMRTLDDSWNAQDWGTFEKHRGLQLRLHVAIESTALYSVDMERLEFCRDALRLSYLDWGGNDRVLIALHAHVYGGVDLCTTRCSIGSRMASCGTRPTRSRRLGSRVEL